MDRIAHILSPTLLEAGPAIEVLGRLGMVDRAWNGRRSPGRRVPPTRAALEHSRHFSSPCRRLGVVTRADAPFALTVAHGADLDVAVPPVTLTWSCLTSHGQCHPCLALAVVRARHPTRDAHHLDHVVAAEMGRRTALLELLEEVLDEHRSLLRRCDEKTDLRAREPTDRPRVRGFAVGSANAFPRGPELDDVDESLSIEHALLADPKAAARGNERVPTPEHALPRAGVNHEHRTFHDLLGRVHRNDQRDHLSLLVQDAEAGEIFRRIERPQVDGLPIGERRVEAHDPSVGERG